MAKGKKAKKGAKRSKRTAGRQSQEKQILGSISGGKGKKFNAADFC